MRSCTAMHEHEKTEEARLKTVYFKKVNRDHEKYLNYVHMDCESTKQDESL